jgi:hypothetical protein
MPDPQPLSEHPKVQFFKISPEGLGTIVVDPRYRPNGADGLLVTCPIGSIVKLQLAHTIQPGTSLIWRGYGICRRTTPRLVTQQQYDAGPIAKPESPLYDVTALFWPCDRRHHLQMTLNLITGVEVVTRYVPPVACTACDWNGSRHQANIDPCKSPAEDRCPLCGEKVVIFHLFPPGPANAG